MPWDGTELWLARVDDSGDLVAPCRVAGWSRRVDRRAVVGRQTAAVRSVGPDRVVEPVWRRADGTLRTLCPIDADSHGAPSGLTVPPCRARRRLDPGRPGRGTGAGASAHARGGAPSRSSTPYTDIAFLRGAGGAVFVGASPTALPPSCASKARTGSCTAMRPATTSAIDPSLVPASGRRRRVPVRVGAWRTACTTRRGGPRTMPPLVRLRSCVRCHARADRSRPGHPRPGGAVLDQPRLCRARRQLRREQRLRAGLPPAALRRLGSRGRRGWHRGSAARGCSGWGGPLDLVVRGSSAGGSTVLCALAFDDVFAAGTSYYGIGDLEALRRDTHKFESYYDQRLIVLSPSGATSTSPARHARRRSHPAARAVLQGSRTGSGRPGRTEAMTAGAAGAGRAG